MILIKMMLMMLMMVIADGNDADDDDFDENADDDVITAIAVHTAAYLDDSIFLIYCNVDVM